MLTNNLSGVTRNNNVEFQIQEKMIGSYGNPFPIKTIHILPKGNNLHSEGYSDWK
ncbi:MAG: hypothetical protein JWN56_2749 [Sphingobacteriales bacterium]|nr:hypothetical protein [Sphingobacteriales bacterium]